MQLGKNLSIQEETFPESSLKHDSIFDKTGMFVENQHGNQSPMEVVPRNHTPIPFLTKFNQKIAVR